ncbi:hypothetical protein CLOM_g12020 [Closterium sp. NIES-68]|nr:hypothetical protein CLOM_g12020 [Closterium sp. NIES-68]
MASQLAWRAAATSASRRLKEGQRFVAAMTSSSAGITLSDVTLGSPRASGISGLSERIDPSPLQADATVDRCRQSPPSSAPLTSSVPLRHLPIGPLPALIPCATPIGSFRALRSLPRGAAAFHSAALPVTAAAGADQNAGGGGGERGDGGENGGGGGEARQEEDGEWRQWIKQALSKDGEDGGTEGGEQQASIASGKPQRQSASPQSASPPSPSPPGQPPHTISSPPSPPTASPPLSPPPARFPPRSSSSPSFSSSSLSSSDFDELEALLGPEEEEEEERGGGRRVGERGEGGEDEEERAARLLLRGGQLGRTGTRGMADVEPEMVLSDRAMRAVKEYDLEDTEEKFQFRPDRVYYPGQTYSAEELDLSQPLPEGSETHRKPRTVTTKEALKAADFRNVRFLSQFISETGKINPRNKTRLSAKAQRRVAREIRTARVFGLMPFTLAGRPPFRFGRDPNLDSGEPDYEALELASAVQGDELKAMAGR